MKRRPMFPTGARVDIRRDVPKPGGWVEIAPGLSMGCREMPSRWRRWLLGKLLGWKFHDKRPG